MLRRDAASARAASDEPRIGKDVPLRTWPIRLPEQRLRVLELFQRDHWLMPRRKPLVLVHDVPRVERIGE